MKYLLNEYIKYKSQKKHKRFEQIETLKCHALRCISDGVEGYLQTPSRILEVGFGSGYSLAVFSDLGHNVFGIEKEDFCFDYAKSILEEKQKKGILIKGDGFALPFKEGVFDLVYSIGLLEHYKPNDQSKLVNEMKRVSKDLVLLCTPNEREHSLYNLYKRLSLFIPEEEYFQDLNKLSYENRLNPLFEKGAHIILPASRIKPEFDEIYKKYSFPLPRQEYYDYDLENLLNFETNVSEEELRRLGFFKFVLGKKF